MECTILSEMNAITRVFSVLFVKHCWLILILNVFKNYAVYFEFIPIL